MIDEVARETNVAAELVGERYKEEVPVVEPPKEIKETTNQYWPFVSIIA